jgi:crotonobetainyl-CoA:carnitine CoA-transferase CaiB-like acyl-CoA transferase
VTSNTWAVTADGAGALAIALAAQMGLYARQRTGRGQRIDLSMVENFVGLIGHVILDYTFNKRIQQSLGNRDYFAVQGCYPCAGDDRWLVLTIADDEAWSRFKTALGEPAWTSDPRLQTPSGRYAEHDLVDARIRDWSRSLSCEEAVQHLRAAGVSAGPVLDDADAYADPHLQARGYFQQVTQADAGTHRYPGPPYQSRRAPLTVRHPPVRLGEHNDYVYRELLGVTAEEFAALEAEGHIGTEYAAHIT